MKLYSSLDTLFMYFHFDIGQVSGNNFSALSLGDENRLGGCKGLKNSRVLLYAPIL